MKKLMILVAALFLVAAASSMATAYTYADEVIVIESPLPEVAGDPHTRVAPPNPNHAPNMNMSWTVDPPGGTPPDPDPSPNPDRLLGARDQYAVGWGPMGSGWTGTGNAIVHMASPFHRDGVVVDRPIVQYDDLVAGNQWSPQNPQYDVTDPDELSEMGYDLVIYGLGYGFNKCFESHAMTTVRISEDGEDWITVSSWNGDPADPNEYFVNQDGTIKDGMPYSNGGGSAMAYTFMTIDLDNPLIIDHLDEDGNPVYKDIGPLDGVYNYIWFEGGDLYDNPGYNGSHGNANFLDAFGANPVPIPGAVWLLGSGLLGLIGIRRRKG